VNFENFAGYEVFNQLGSLRNGENDELSLPTSSKREKRG
jgi:hypothetical protein